MQNIERNHLEGLLYKYYSEIIKEHLVKEKWDYYKNNNIKLDVEIKKYICKFWNSRNSKFYNN